MNTNINKRINYNNTQIERVLNAYILRLSKIKRSGRKYDKCFTERLLPSPIVKEFRNRSGFVEDTSSGIFLFLVYMFLLQFSPLAHNIIALGMRLLLVSSVQSCICALAAFPYITIIIGCCCWQTALGRCPSLTDVNASVVCAEFVRHCSLSTHSPWTTRPLHWAEQSATSVLCRGRSSVPATTAPDETVRSDTPMHSIGLYFPISRKSQWIWNRM